jgi:uncharacterized protein YjiS (DUF1127 family)
MSSQLTLPSLRSGDPAFFKNLAPMVVRTLHAIIREWRIRRDLGRLADFDDAMLRDIGVARSEIEPALRHGRSFRGTATSAN